MQDKIADLGLESQKVGLLTSDRFHDKTIIFFNSASFCGYTHQLKEFQEIYSEGLAVPIAIPTNNFGSQEPGDNYEIQQFYSQKYGVEFPICTKQTTEHDFFIRFGKPKWNFNKYLFNRKHDFVKQFGSDVSPRQVIDEK
jgi:glutathione peroxidase